MIVKKRILICKYVTPQSNVQRLILSWLAYINIDLCECIGDLALEHFCYSVLWTITLKFPVLIPVNVQFDSIKNTLHARQICFLFLFLYFACEIFFKYPFDHHRVFCFHFASFILRSTPVAKHTVSSGAQVNNYYGRDINGLKATSLLNSWSLHVILLENLKLTIIRFLLSDYIYRVYQKKVKCSSALNMVFNTVGNTRLFALEYHRFYKI